MATYTGNILKTALIIVLKAAFIYSHGQEVLKICNCFQTPVECSPDTSKRNIVSYDTSFRSHSSCLIITATDEHFRIVVWTDVCNEDPKGSTPESFFDPRTIGNKFVTWYDTAGKELYSTFSEYDTLKECYWYHHAQGQKRYDYIIGYRDGELFKETATWDEHGANCTERVIITEKTITTITVTKERDPYGNFIQKTTTIPNKAGKVE